MRDVDRDEESKHRSPILFLAPAFLIFVFFYAGALIMLFVQSLQTYTPGRIVQVSQSFSFANYIIYWGRNLVYYGFLWDSLRIGGIATVISVLIAYPLAHKISRTERALVKKTLLTVLVATFFINSIVKVYSWVIMQGDAGLINEILTALGYSKVRFLGTDEAVIIGLIYFLFPIATMALIGPIKNVDSTLEQAAGNLGATNTQVFFDVTLPLSMPGTIAATLLCYALAVSAFIIPMFLGSGIVLMMSNIIFSRYSESFNYPGGAALAMVFLATILFIAFGINRLLTKRLKGFGYG